MKLKSIVMLLFMLTIFLFSCEKENADITQNQSAVDGIVKLPKADRKMAFNLLTPEEKAQVWG